MNSIKVNKSLSRYLLKLNKPLSTTNIDVVKTRTIFPNVNYLCMQSYNTSNILYSNEKFKPLREKILYTSVIKEKFNYNGELDEKQHNKPNHSIKNDRHISNTTIW